MLLTCVLRSLPCDIGLGQYHSISLCLFFPTTSSCRLMGIARSAVVCFVVDTTGSMTDDIVEARRVIYDIIDSRKGTQDEPSEYILVPFNDPGKTFGTLLIR